jgi:hypothetical protein
MKTIIRRIMLVHNKRRGSFIITAHVIFLLVSLAAVSHLHNKMLAALPTEPTVRICQDAVNGA